MLEALLEVPREAFEEEGIVGVEGEGEILLLDCEEHLLSVHDQHALVGALFLGAKDNALYLYSFPAFLLEEVHVAFGWGAKRAKMRSLDERCCLLHHAQRSSENLWRSEILNHDL